MLLALQLSVSLLAVLASPGQARSLAVKLPDYEGADYSYGDLDYGYDIRDDRLQSFRPHDPSLIWASRAQPELKWPKKTRGNGKEQSPQEKEVPPHPLDDPDDFSYSYGDPAYDYHPGDDRREEPGADGPQTDGEEETAEVDHRSRSEGARNGTEAENGLASPPAPPENGDDDTGDRDDETTPGALRWFENRWHEAKSQMERMMSDLRGVKDSMVAFLYRFSDKLERGAEYCIQKLRATAQDIDSRANQALEKLEHQLKKGNERVVQLIHLIGTKVQEWSGQHQGAMYRDGDRVPGFTIRRNDVDLTPNFFQDEAVSEQLSRLVKDDILTEGEVVVLKMA